MLGGSSGSFLSFSRWSRHGGCGSSITCKAFALARMDVPRDALRFRVQVGVQRMVQLPGRYVASDFLDDQRADGQIGVRLKVVQSTHSRPIELVGGGFEPTVGSLDSDPLGIEVFP